MNRVKVDENFFKGNIDYGNLDDSIYDQFAKVMAKNIDIDIAITPLVDLLTGYIQYKILRNRIDKAIEFNKQTIQDIEDFYRPTSDKIYSGDVIIEKAQININILNGDDNNEDNNI